MVRGNAKVKSQAKRLKRLEAERKSQKRDPKAQEKARMAGFRFVCPECKQSLANLKVALEHFYARHPKSSLPTDWQRRKEEAEAEKKAIEDEKRRKKKAAEDAKKKIFAIKACLRSFYEEHAPDKAGNIEKIMKKYAGKWEKLEAALEKSYGDKAPKIVQAAETAVN